jgi:predicted DNA-binding transcriptional regulator YafY
MPDGWDGFEHEQRRDAGEASESVARKIWLILELLRHRSVRFSEYERLHARDKRSFQRDLQQLRAIGKNAGFAISSIERGEVVRLSALDSRIRRLDGARAPLLRLLAELSRALGEPLRGELETIAAGAPDGEVFLHIRSPELAEGSSVAKVYARLKDAWESSAGPASVRFRYRAAKGAPEERLVDPYRVVVRSGRYYLVGYDVGRRGWRNFALDAIVGLPVKAGTIRTIRAIPADYGSDDVLGFLKGPGKTLEVTVELSAAIAASATSRIWNRAQRVEKLSGGRARITIPVSDPSEVIRWAFGFGPEARVVAPPAIVATACAMAQEMAVNQGSPPD